MVYLGSSQITHQSINLSLNSSCENVLLSPLFSFDINQSLHKHLVEKKNNKMYGKQLSLFTLLVMIINKKKSRNRSDFEHIILCIYNYVI